MTHESGCSLLCEGHMVTGQGQTVGLILKCCLLNIWWVKLWIKVRLSTANQRNEASQKIVAYFAIKPMQADRTLNSILFVRPQIWNFLAYMKPFWILHQGLIYVSQTFLVLIALNHQSQKQINDIDLLLGRLCHSVDLLLWVGVRQRASSHVR